jgi:hypothetical protein
LRDTVFWPVAMPAQLTVSRSWPWAARALAKAAATSSSVGHVDIAEDAAQFLRNGLALLLVHVEQGDLRARGGDGAGRALAETGGAAGDDRSDRAVEFHAKSPYLV